MSWRYSRRLPKTGGVIDADDHNDTLAPFGEELDGHLGEHNFNEILGSQLDRSADLEANVGFRCMHKYTEVDAGDGADPTRATLVPGSGSWVTLSDLTMDFASDGGQLYVLFTAQLGNDQPDDYRGASSTAASAYRDDFSSLQIAIRINGAVYPLSVTGDQDFQEEGRYLDRGPCGWMMHAESDICVPIPAGSIKVEFVVRCLLEHTAGLADRNGLVYHREAVALEMW